MKRTILTLMVLLLSGVVLADQKPINGYGDLQFQMSLEDVKTTIKKDGNYNLEQVPLKNYYRYFPKSKSEISVWFDNGKLVQIREVFGGDRLNKLESAKVVFKEKRKELISLWGTPTKDVKNLVVWDRAKTLGVLLLEPPDNPYAYPVLKLVVGTDKKRKEVLMAID